MSHWFIFLVAILAQWLISCKDKPLLLLALCALKKILWDRAELQHAESSHDNSSGSHGLQQGHMTSLEATSLSSVS